MRARERRRLRLLREVQDVPAVGAHELRSRSGHHARLRGLGGASRHARRRPRGADAGSPPESPRATTTVTIVPVSQPTYLAAPAAMATAGAPKVSAEEVVVSLRMPDVERSGDDRVTAQADAGGRSAVIVLIRNQSGVVDNYRVGVDGDSGRVVDGIPCDGLPRSVRISRGSYEEEIELQFHPPRSAEAEARSWPIEVVAHSKALDADVGSAQATLVITPYQQLEQRAPPGHRHGSPESRLRDHGEQQRERADRHDRLGGGCRGRARVRLRLTPLPGTAGSTRGHEVLRAPNKQIWIGRSDRPPLRGHRPGRRRRRERAAAPGESSARSVAPVGTRGSSRSPSRRPSSLSCSYQDHELPDLIGKKAGAAPAILEDANLKLSPEPPAEKVADAPGGTIVGVVPAVGKKFKKGTVVQITVAQPAVPKLIGKTQPQARLTLAKVGLKLSPAAPQKKVSTKPVGSIVGQIPGAGRRLSDRVRGRNRRGRRNGDAQCPERHRAHPGRGGEDHPRRRGSRWS